MANPQQLIAQTEARRLNGDVSAMTWWRWRNAGIVPEPVVIQGRNYYRASDLAKMQNALANRRTQEIA